MKKSVISCCIMLILISSVHLYAQNDNDSDIIPIYEGSSVKYDDDIGFNLFAICTGKIDEKTAKIEQVEGYIRHRFCYAPANRSAYEIIKNYEEAVKQKDGKVFPIVQKRECINAFMKKGHPGHGMQNYEYMQLSTYAGEYFSGKISTDEYDYYIAVVAGKIDSKVVYSLVTVQVKAMDTGKVTLENIEEGIAEKGHIAIYNIYFDTGKYDVKEESNEALKIIAEYMKAHPSKKYYVVGHTDNVGGFEMNLQLSEDRAKAVVNALATNHGVNAEQLKAHGIGPLSPVKSNKDDSGKTKNRRVEIVEQ